MLERTHTSNAHAQPNRRCGRCHAPFHCAGSDAKSGCWCAELPNVMPVPGGGEGCWCPACLQDALSAQAPPD